MLKLIIAFLLSLNPGIWHLEYPIGNIPLGSTPMELFFDFPVAPDQPGSTSVNYLIASFNGSLSNSQALRTTFRVDTSGTPVFGYHTESGNTCSYPAHVRLYFEVKGWKKHPNDGDGRWWSNPVAYQLQSTAGATVSLVVNLTPDQWSNVWGQMGSSRPRQFTSGKRAIEGLGLSFGGGCFFGHGVNVSGGTARFILNSYEIIP